MAEEDKIWSPRCVTYVSTAHLDYGEPGEDEVHLEFETEDGRTFVLKMTSAEAPKLWEGLSVMIQSSGFPSGAGEDEVH